MKYIKLFNESLNSDNLREFCEINLAYLLDEYDLKMTPITLNSGAEAQILEIRTYTKYNRDTSTFSNPIGHFYWNDIKDHVIPFLKRLKKSYRIYGITFDARGYSGAIDIKGSSINALINEQYDRITIPAYSYALLNKDFTYFSIVVREKL
jgi:hypothetical protein